MSGSMHPNATLLHEFYGAFAAHDADRMVACYAPDAEFSDPVFPLLRGDEVRAMWRMLCEGKIAAHRDAFDLWRWAGMALGARGRLLGWLPPVQASVRRQADASLRAYVKKRG